MSPDDCNRLQLRPTLAMLRWRLAHEFKGQDEFDVEHDELRLRVATIPALNGTFWAIRRGLPKPPPLTSFVNLPHLHLPLLRHDNRPGLILIAGATGAGKTTLISTLLTVEQYGASP